MVFRRNKAPKPPTSTLTVLYDSLPDHTEYVENSTTLNGELVPDIEEDSPLFNENLVYEGMDFKGMFVQSPNADLHGLVFPGEENVAEVTFKVKVNKDVKPGTIIKNIGVIDDDSPETPKNSNENEVEAKGIEKNINGTSEVILKDREEAFTYNIVTEIPDEIERFTEFKITDNIDEGIDILNTVLTVDGKSYRGIKLTKRGNSLVAIVTDFEGLKDKKKINISITAKVKEDTDFDEYKDRKIPNTARIDYKYMNEEDNEIVGEAETPPVFVTEQPKSPITKDAEGKQDLIIDLEGEFEFNIITQIPKQIKDYTKFVISDDVDDALEIIGMPKVTVDGETFDGISISKSGNFIEVEVEDFAGLDGKKKIELVIKAKIKEDADLSEYEDSKIPNTAKYEFVNEHDEDGEKEIPPVTVTPEEPGDFTAAKKVNQDKAIPGEALAYTIEVTNTSEDKVLKDVTVEDDLPNGLNLVADTIELNGESVDADVDGNKFTVIIPELKAGETAALMMNC